MRERLLALRGFDVGYAVVYLRRPICLSLRIRQILDEFPRGIRMLGPDRNFSCKAAAPGPVP